MDDFPTAHEVAVAIVAACRETGANPLRVASHQMDADCSPKVYETSRARAYAAWALKSRFPNCGHVAIGRMVGSNCPKVYLSTLASTRPGCRWWSKEASLRVKAALDAHRAKLAIPEPARENNKPERPAAPPRPRSTSNFNPSPAYSAPPSHYPGKKDLYEDLRRAVENTAKMTPERS